MCVFFFPSCSFHLLVSVSASWAFLMDVRPQEIKLTATQPLYSRLNAADEAGAVISFSTLDANQTTRLHVLGKLYLFFFFFNFETLSAFSPHKIRAKRVTPLN